MDTIKKFGKEISVFGVVILVFLGLFIYHQATFKDYKTVKSATMTQMIEDKKDFVVVLGDSTDTTVQSYQNVMTKYTTNNRSTPLYYVDTKTIDDVESYVEKTFDTNGTYPLTLIIKDGKVVAQKSGYLQYYSLYDFIKEGFE